MRWNEKPRAYWIEFIGDALCEFSEDIELLDFKDGAAEVRLIEGKYDEDYHIKLQDFIDSKSGGGVAIFFPQAGNS